MDNETKNLLLIVVCFSIASKLYKDYFVLASSLPILVNLFFYPLDILNIYGSVLLTFLNLILFGLTIIGSLIVPIYLIKYVLVKRRAILNHDFVMFMFKPQLYAGLIGIIQFILSNAIFYLQ